MLWKIIDDDNNEVDVNDIVTIMARIPRKLKMEEPSNAIVKEIQATYITILFMDPLYGDKPIQLRKPEILQLSLYKKASQ